MARNIAMHVAALKPQYVAVEEVPVSVVRKEEEIFLEQLPEAQRGKADKILPGKIEKFFEEVVLLKQPYVRDDSGKKTIKDLVDDLSAKVGEKVVVRRFQRFEVGEGIEKPVTNLAEDVAAMTAN